MMAKGWLLLLTKNNNGDFASREILLITHVLIGGQQQIKPGVLCGSDQIAVFELVPALLSRSRNTVAA